MNDSEWYVYIVRASDQTLYTGITTDLDRRLAEHQSGKGGAKYFRGRDALEMVFTEFSISHVSGNFVVLLYSYRLHPYYVTPLCQEKCYMLHI